MNRFVRFVFVLVLISSALSFALVTVSNIHTNRDRQNRLAQERAAITQNFNALNERPMHALFTVESQQIAMTPGAKKRQIASTTLLFGLCDESFHAPAYVQRIAIASDKVTITGVKMAFHSAFTGEQSLLNGHTFYLFDTIAGDENAPFEINPLGYPPLALRHASPDFTEFEKQLWRPIWDIIVSTPQISSARGVILSPLNPATQTLQPEKLYKTLVASSGITIIGVDDVGDTISTMLNTARDQDEQAATGTRPATPIINP